VKRPARNFFGLVEESQSGFRSAPALGEGKKQQGGLPG